MFQFTTPLAPSNHQPLVQYFIGEMYVQCFRNFLLLKWLPFSLRLERTDSRDKHLWNVKAVSVPSDTRWKRRSQSCPQRFIGSLEKQHTHTWKVNYKHKARMWDMSHVVYYRVMQTALSTGDQRRESFPCVGITNQGFLGWWHYWSGRWVGALDAK